MFLNRFDSGRKKKIFALTLVLLIIAQLFPMTLAALTSTAAVDKENRENKSSISENARKLINKITGNDKNNGIGQGSGGSSGGARSTVYPRAPEPRLPVSEGEWDFNITLPATNLSDISGSVNVTMPRRSRRPVKVKAPEVSSSG